MKPNDAAQAVQSDESGPGSPLPAHKYCAQCGYRLNGLPDSGVCPECGQRYHEGTIQWRPLPTPLEIIARFAWPPGVQSLLTVVLNTGVDPRLGGVLFVLIAISVLCCYANIPLQMFLLRRSGVIMSGAPPAAHDYWIAIMIVASMGAPLLILAIAVMTRD